MKTDAPKLTDDQKRRLTEAIKQDRERKLALERSRRIAIRCIVGGILVNVALTAWVLINQFLS